MKYFAVVFAAMVALSVATPVELQERQGDFINTIIEMIKGFICEGEIPVRNSRISRIPIESNVLGVLHQQFSEQYRLEQNLHSSYLKS